MRRLPSVPDEALARLLALPGVRESAGASALVTGVTGLVGECLARTLLRASDEFGLKLRIYGLARRADVIARRFAGSALVPLPGDVTLPLPAAAPRFDYVVHAASPVGPAVFAREPVSVVRANLLGTVNLLEGASAAACRRFVFISTHEVYGSGREVWREGDSGVLDFLSPRSCYPQAKRAGENACVCYGREFGLSTGIARLSRIYGAGMNLDSGLFVCDFVRDALAGRRIRVRGGWNLPRPLLHVSDAVMGILHILFAGRPGEVYNVSPDETWTVGEIAAEIGRLAGVGFDAPPDGLRAMAGARQDNAKLKGLGWIQRLALRNGLEETLKELFLDEGAYSCAKS